MSKRKFKSQAETINQHNATDKELNTRPVAVYYRQSTTAQVGNISTSIQTVDMVEELKRRGWAENDIILIDDDEGVSGTTRIDEREGMSQLFVLIADGKIGAVAVQDEDRLFRDLTQIQVNIFIDTCRKSQVAVITPYFTYNFSHPAHGEFHARQFRYKCDMAADFIKSYILGRLTPAKRRLRRKGLWAGSATPAGYMVDIRQKLMDGTDNPNWRKFIPFEAHAEIVRAYFRVFIENNGAIRKTMRQIKAEGLSLPDVPVPDGFKTNSHLKKRNGKYFVNRGSFVRMLTNPVYIGHWMTNGTITIWDNHEPIVEPKIFMRVFNYLSPHTLTGESNENYEPAYQYERPQKNQQRNVERPLCVGLICTEVDNDRVYKAGVMFDKRTEQYLYVLNRVEIDGTHAEWARRANWIDQAIIDCFKAKLDKTYQADVWMKSVTESGNLVERERKLKRLQLKSLEGEKQNLITSLGSLSHELMIQEVENRFKRVEQEEKRLIKELASLEEQRHQHISIEQAHMLFKKVLEDWDAMTYEEKRNILSLFIKRIDALDYNRSGEMVLNIYWKDNSNEKVEIWHKPHSDLWTMEKVHTLLGLFDRGLGQLEIAKEFPNVKWYQIFNEIKKHRGNIRLPVSYIRKSETYTDYLAIGGRKGKATCSPWRPEEIELLEKMVKNGATRLELMEQFPVRRYKQLREKIKQVLGELPFIPNPDEISQDATYHEYAQEKKVVKVDACSESANLNF